jgi:hypothetical protein
VKTLYLGISPRWKGQFKTDVLDQSLFHAIERIITQLPAYILSIAQTIPNKMRASGLGIRAQRLMISATSVWIHWALAQVYYERWALPFPQLPRYLPASMENHLRVFA